MGEDTKPTVTGAAKKPFRFSGAGTMQEEAAKDAFPVFAENLYIAEVVECGMVEEEAKEWDGNVFVPIGGTWDRLEIKFKLLRTVAGGPVLDTKGAAAKSDTIVCFPRLNLEKLGYSRGGATKGQPFLARKVLTAVLGVAVDAPIPEFDDKTLIGKKVQVYISVVPKKDGEMKNVMDKFTPFVEKA